MNNELQNKINELYNLLDNLECIKNITNLKKNIDDDLLLLIENYRMQPTIENKKTIYNNKVFLEYIQNETELNYLIREINQKFKRNSGNCARN